jgi:NodT family efflux transporter outer membrane factor (OMF) lipoprotein
VKRPQSRVFKLNRLVACGAVVLALGACQSFKAPVPEGLAIPSQFDVPETDHRGGNAPDSKQPWWFGYHDDVLNQLISTALDKNPDIEIALAHLREAEAIDSSGWTHFAPNADVSAGGGHGTGSDDSRSRVGSVLGSADNNKTLTHLTAVGGVEATWQIDLTGKIADQVKSIHANTEALRAARSFLVSRIIAEVVQSYAQTRGLQTELALNSHSREKTDELFELINNRQHLGLASQLELDQVRRDRDKTRADEQAIQVQLALSENRLASVVGVYRREIELALKESKPVPMAGGELNVGVPLEVIQNRGDVQFSALTLIAARADSSSQVARLFPTIGLTAAVGQQQQDLNGVPNVTQHIWSVGPALFWPILDFGSLDAEIEASRWKTREALIKYKTTIQQAVSDVETHANAYKRSLERVKSLESALEASHQSSQLTLNRYQNGLTDYLHVIDAYRQEDVVAKEYTEASIQVAVEWATLQVSLGQGQDAVVIADHPFTPKPAIVALFTQFLNPRPEPRQ